MAEGTAEDTTDKQDAGPPEKERHVFRAPAPRKSLLGMLTLQLAGAQYFLQNTIGSLTTCRAPLEGWGAAWTNQPVHCQSQPDDRTFH